VIIDFSVLFDRLGDQITLLQIMIMREAVQRQIMTIFAILLFTWLAPRIFDMALKRLARHIAPEQPKEGDDAPVASPPRTTQPGTAPKGGGASPLEKSPTDMRLRIIRWLRAIDFVLFPTLYLLISQRAITRFAENGWPSGLIEAVMPVFWVVLGYRVLAGALLAILPDDQSGRAEAEVLRPIVWILILVIARNILFSTLGLSEIALLRLSEWVINLGDLLDAAIAVLLAMLFAGAMRKLIYNLMIRSDAESDVAGTVSNVLRYGIVSLGFLIGLGMLGIDLGALAWIGGGLSLGLGFGLQELFGNFVSGIVLVFERIVRPGDVIEVQGMRGAVTKVFMRATVLRTPDNTEIFVPNKELMTKPVTAMTYSDTLARVRLDIGVAYDSDLELAERVLLETIQRHPMILNDPAPGVLVTSMSPYSIEYLAFGHVTQFSDSFRVRSELFQMVRDAFLLHGIVIPFPRQDVRVFSESDKQNAENMHPNESRVVRAAVEN
jgi:small-conductance mechanosensitive channel